MDYESHYRACYDHSMDGILLTIPDGTILAANPAACELFGMTEEEICERGRFNLVDETEPNFEKLIKQRKETGKTSGELTFKRKDGTLFVGYITSSVFNNEVGEPRTCIIIRDITEKVIADKKAKETEMRYKQIVELALEGIWVIDENNNTSFVNDAMAAMLGYTKEEMLGKDLFYFMNEEGREISRRNIERRKNGIEDKHDFTFQTKDGRAIWTMLSTTPIFNNGKYGGAMALVTDITDRKRADDQLHRSEERFRVMVENNYDIILLLDGSLETVYRSPSTSRIMGYGNDQRIGRNYLELVHPYDVEIALQFQKSVITNPGQAMPVKLRVKHADGQYLWLEGYATNLLHLKNIEAIVVNLHDITERKKITDDLWYLTNRLQLATRAANIAIWDWDIVNDQLMWDNAMYSLYGVDQDAFGASYESWITCVHPNDRDAQTERINDAVANQKDFDTEFRIVTPDQSIRYVRSIAINEYDANGKPLRMVGINWDITDQKLAAEEKEKIMADLVRRNKDLENFTYTISHNLRAPVANVIGLSDLLHNDDIDKLSKVSILDGLSVSIKKIDEVIIDLHDILQSKHQINSQKEHVVFKVLLEDINLSISNIIAKENVQINYFFDEVDGIYTIHSYLYSIIYNLVLNSIKYRRPDVSPVIHLSSKLEAGFVVLTIKDNGKGIDLVKNKAMLFGLYKRFDHTIEGKGIGLYMVKTQTEALGGTIEVESEIGNGCIFIVKIPVG
ncbi:MAG: PAS domain S-box protein [Mucilaginibacter sp.]